MLSKFLNKKNTNFWANFWIKKLLILEQKICSKFCSKIYSKICLKLCSKFCLKICSKICSKFYYECESKKSVKKKIKDFSDVLRGLRIQPIYAADCAFQTNPYSFIMRLLSTSTSILWHARPIGTDLIGILCLSLSFHY